MRISVLFYLLHLLLTVSTSSANAAEHILSAVKDNTIDSVYLLKASKMTLLDVNTVTRADQQWIKISNLTYGLPIDPYHTWFKFQVSPNSNSLDQWRLAFGQALRIKQLKYWLMVDGKFIHEQQYRSTIPELSGQFATTPAFDLSFNSTQASTQVIDVILYVESEHAGYLPLKISPEKHTLAEEQQQLTITGAVIGALIFGALVFLSAALITNARQNSLASLMLALLTLSLLAWVNMLGFKSTTNDMVILLAMGLSAVSLLELARAQQQKRQRSDWIILGLVVVALLISLSIETINGLIILLCAYLVMVLYLLFVTLSHRLHQQKLTYLAFVFLACAITLILTNVAFQQMWLFATQSSLLLCSYFLMAFAIALIGLSSTTQSSHKKVALQSQVNALQHELQSAQQQLDDWQEDTSQLIEQAVEQRTATLTQAINELEEQSEESLESAIQERTLELNIALQELEEANRALEKKNTTDELSGLFNRRFFDQRFLAEYRRSKREITPLSLLLIDIDHFKQVNDTYGHLVGDECIRRVGQILKQQLKRSSDVACRYGGEEFCLILPHTDTEGAVAFANSLREIIAAAEIPVDNTTITMTISCGVVTYMQQDNVGLDQIFQSVDNALYKAKESGRNNVQQLPIEPAT